MRDDIHERVTYLAEAIGRSARATCAVCIRWDYPVTVNDPALTQTMLPTLQRVAGVGGLKPVPKVMGSEDFPFFQRMVPGLFVEAGAVEAPSAQLRAGDPLSHHSIRGTAAEPQQRVVTAVLRQALELIDVRVLDQ
jgi:metal-dependent amidase/aminoacylase/carboxypeptidase family protein